MRYEYDDYEEYPMGNGSFNSAEPRRPMRMGRGMEFNNSWQSNRNESTFPGPTRGRGRGSAGYSDMSHYGGPSRGFNNMDRQEEMGMKRNFDGKMYKMPNKGLLDSNRGMYSLSSVTDQKFSQPPNNAEMSSFGAAPRPVRRGGLRGRQKFKELTKKRDGEIISVVRIPIDESGNQIGPEIIDYENEDVLEAANLVNKLRQKKLNQMGGYEGRRQYIPSQSQHPSLLADPILEWPMENMRNDYPPYQGRGGQLGVRNRLQFSSKRPIEDPFMPEPLMAKRARLSVPIRGIRGRGRGRIINKSIIRTTNESESSPVTATNEEKAVAEGSNKKLEVPVAALFCHICNQGEFTSDKAYKDHIQGMKHKSIAMSFFDKNELDLELLRKKALLARIRSGDCDSKFLPKICDVCLVPVSGRFKEHKQNVEHNLVRNFMRPSCCGRSFKTRHDMEEHRLSMPHLNKMYLEKIEKQEKEMENETFASFKEAIDELKKKLGSDLEDVTLENLPAYDGNTMIGINFIEPKQAAFCKVCRTTLAFDSLESHLASLSHFNTLQEHLNNQGKELLKAEPSLEDDKTKETEPTQEEEAGKEGETRKNYRNVKFNRELGDNDSDDEDSEDELAKHIAEADESEAEEGDDLPPIEEENFVLYEDKENGETGKSESKESETSEAKDTECAADSNEEVKDESAEA